MESEPLKIPEGIDAAKAVGKLTNDELRTLAASIHRQIGWREAGEKARKRTGARISAARKKMPAKRRSDLAKAAAAARWDK